MSNKPERVNLSWTPIGNVFISSTNPTTAYVRADVAEKMMKEQRQMCADAVIVQMGGSDYAGDLLSARLEKACLNATGESDDQS